MTCEFPALAGHTILTGDRPTGPLHIGHLAGTLEARIALQEDNAVTILVADMQALTDNAGRAADVAANVREVVLDYVAAGIDPERVTIVRQSDLPALAELTAFYLNLVPLSRLMRNPTIREETEARGFGDGIPAGFLCYPVSQAADITAFGADIVPAGADQAPLVELAAEIARGINRRADHEVLTPPRLVESLAPRLPGIDGLGKMSKSAGNAIALADTPDEIRRKVMAMFTDPGHLRVADPGRVEGNVVFAMLDAFDPDADAVMDLKAQYEAGGLGDMVLKRRLEAILQERLAPMRERRAATVRTPGLVEDILETGRRASEPITRRHLDAVRGAFGLPARQGGPVLPGAAPLAGAPVHP